MTQTQFTDIFNTPIEMIPHWEDMIGKSFQIKDPHGNAYSITIVRINPEFRYLFLKSCRELYLVDPFKQIPWPFINYPTSNVAICGWYQFYSAGSWQLFDEICRDWAWCNYGREEWSDHQRREFVYEKYFPIPRAFLKRLIDEYREIEIAWGREEILPKWEAN